MKVRLEVDPDGKKLLWSWYCMHVIREHETVVEKTELAICAGVICLVVFL